MCEQLDGKHRIQVLTEVSPGLSGLLFSPQVSDLIKQTRLLKKSEVPQC